MKKLMKMQKGKCLWHGATGKACLAMGVLLGLVSLSEVCVAAESAAPEGTPVYTLQGITVEAKRPDWEAKLSPGTVTVIRPQDFKGEQKTLPDMLKTVP